MSFETAALVFGVLLILAPSGRNPVPLSAAAVLAGLALGAGGLEVLDFDARSGFVEILTVVALVVILFRDGLEVEAEMLQTEWRLPLRKLVLAMPITAGVVAVAAHALTGLNWTESFLLGALLSPTDPVLSSGIVTNARVPRLIRHSLNLESGLNDGLALAPVLALTAALSAEDGFVWWEFVAQDVGLGFAYGLAGGFLAALVLPRQAGLEGGLGAALATYGATVLDPHGNGFIAVFVCAIVLGIRRPDVRVSFERRSGDAIEILKLLIFVVFGSLLTIDGLFGDGWAAIAIVAVVFLVARPVAVWLALAGTKTGRDTLAFMAWFGPKGVATMTFSLIVLGAGLEAGEQIFNLAALCVVVSIVAHGLTDEPGVGWIERRTLRR